jgi:ABC-2 type transport system permease protein
MTAPTPAAATAAATTDDATIYDRGYRAYDGPRTGVTGALRTLIGHSLKAVLGIGRSGWAKVIPVAVILMSYTPAAVFVGVAALLPDEFQGEVLPDYQDYYGFITAALFLFAAFVAPELLCTDRRTGMLGVYLASPLNRATYLIGKTISVGILLAVVTIGPPLLMLIGLSLIDAGPEGLADTLLVGGRILLAGTMMSAIFAAISMAVSATTERKTFAGAAIVGIFVGFGIIANVLVEEAGRSIYWRLIDVLLLPVELTYRIFGSSNQIPTVLVPSSQVWLACLAVIGLCAAWVWDRYRRMLVRR